MSDAEELVRLKAEIAELQGKPEQIAIAHGFMEMTTYEELSELLGQILDEHEVLAEFIECTTTGLTPPMHDKEFKERIDAAMARYHLCLLQVGSAFAAISAPTAQAD